MIHALRIDTPVGPLTIAASGRAVTSIRFGVDVPAGAVGCTPDEAPPLLRRAAGELAEYFAGSRRTFTLPLAPDGTPFQRRVWEALCTIPYGETRTYGEVAAAIGQPRASRAVGMANHRNPLVIVIPCHRVIGADGSLTGYAGGLERKLRLLTHEQQPEFSFAGTTDQRPKAKR